jgi:hypothetical protein
LKTIRNALHFLVVTDWDTFTPLSKHLMERFKLSVNPWGSFEWLPTETRRHMERREGEGKENKSR